MSVKYLAAGTSEVGAAGDAVWAGFEGEISGRSVPGRIGLGGANML